MTPLERAARALFQYEPGPYGDCVEWAIEQDFGWKDRVAEVKLVLEAIREPSGEIVQVLQKATDDRDIRTAVSTSGLSDFEAMHIWQAMIDAALSEGG